MKLWLGILWSMGVIVLFCLWLADHRQRAAVERLSEYDFRYGSHLNNSPPAVLLPPAEHQPELQGSLTIKGEQKNGLEQNGR
jgi:hypothetical protein